MSNNKGWYQIMAKVYWSFDSTRIVYPIKFLLLQTIVIIVVIKLVNFDTNTHNPELYLLSFNHFLFSLEFKNAAKWQKYNSGFCAFVPKCAYLSQQYSENSITIICNSKNLIGYTGLVLSNDQ